MQVELKCWIECKEGEEHRSFKSTFLSALSACLGKDGSMMSLTGDAEKCSKRDIRKVLLEGIGNGISILTARPNEVV